MCDLAIKVLHYKVFPNVCLEYYKVVELIFTFQNVKQRYTLIDEIERCLLTRI